MDMINYNNDKKKAVISFSGGKDSILSLYRIKDNYQVIGLISTIDETDYSCFHHISKNILKEIADSLKLPLITVSCTKDVVYEEEFEKELSKTGADICVFGDIDIERHKQWDIDRCRKCNMKAVFPLWQEDREMLVNEFINAGFTAVIKKVALNYLNESFLGRELDTELIQKIKACGSDPCGENGEYHTIVIDGPLFENKINIKKTGNKISGDHGYLEIE